MDGQDLPILSKISTDDLRDIVSLGDMKFVASGQAKSLNPLGESMYPDAHLLRRGMSDLISPLA
jgi:hypothetical protein